MDWRPLFRKTFIFDSLRRRLQRRRTHFVTGSEGQIPQRKTSELRALEGATQGRIIIDFAMDGIGPFNQPIQLDVRDGRVISIRGNKEAQELRRLLEGDQNAFVVAEVAIGTNPKSRMKGNMAEDKILLGSVHVAVGDNHTMGGQLQSRVHLDGIILSPTVELDGQLVVEKAKLLAFD